jgi:hypothetical protein
MVCLGKYPVRRIGAETGERRKNLKITLPNNNALLNYLASPNSTESVLRGLITEMKCIPLPEFSLKSFIRAGKGEVSLP